MMVVVVLVVMMMVNWVGGHGWPLVCQVVSRCSFVGLYLGDRS
jgi:hypothetical protein